MRPYKQAKYDILWVLDSNVLVDRGTLARAVDALCNQPASSSRKRPMGLVHHVPFAFLCEKSLGSRIEEAFLNTNHAKMYLALNILAIDSCVTGKSCLYRRSDVEKLTADLKPKTLTNGDPDSHAFGSRKGFGLAEFGRFMAEDNMIGAAIWHELGQRHDLSCDVAENAIGTMSFMDYVWRRVRWIRVRKHMVLAATILEPLTESVVVGILAAWAIRRLVGIPMWLFLFLHFSVWILVDLDVYAALAGHPVPRNEQMYFFVAWALRELCALPIWAVAIAGSEVRWRGTRYQMLPNGECKRADEGRKRRWFGTRSDQYVPIPSSVP
ncbi:hypothetical protein FRC02_008220 [Tulasnella sp. 418]|nr:hypothetical protein FRC02_008220 [Tulasnella sp. 418]